MSTSHVRNCHPAGVADAHSSGNAIRASTELRQISRSHAEALPGLDEWPAVVHSSATNSSIVTAKETGWIGRELRREL